VGAHTTQRDEGVHHRDVRPSEVGRGRRLSEVAHGGARTSPYASENIRTIHTRDCEAIGGLSGEKASRGHMREARKRWWPACVVRVARSNEQRSNPHIKGVQKRQRRSQCSREASNTAIVDNQVEHQRWRRVTQGAPACAGMMWIPAVSLQDKARRTSPAASSEKWSADNQPTRKQCTTRWVRMA